MSDLTCFSNLHVSSLPPCHQQCLLSNLPIFYHSAYVAPLCIELLGIMTADRQLEITLRMLITCQAVLSTVFDVLLSITGISVSRWHVQLCH